MSTCPADDHGAFEDKRLVKSDEVLPEICTLYGGHWEASTHQRAVYASRVSPVVVCHMLRVALNSVM